MRGLTSLLVSCALALAALQGADARAHPLRLRAHPHQLRARGTCRSHRPAVTSSAVAAASHVPASSLAVVHAVQTSSSTKAAPTTSIAKAKPQTSAAAPKPQAEATPAPAASSGSQSSSGDSNSKSPSSSSGSTPSSNSNTNTGGAVSNADIQTYLSAHNSVRAAHGAGNLVWNNTLEAAAQTWANKCVFQHSGGSLGPFGENLAAGTGGETIQQGVQDWANEASQYDASNPQPSHFTQMVWKSSTQLGCAVASCSGIFDASFGPANFYVCEYFPQGNVIGEFAQNVSA